MRDNNDDLWEGIELLTPGEMERTITPEPTSETAATGDEGEGTNPPEDLGIETQGVDISTVERTSSNEGIENGSESSTEENTETPSGNESPSNVSPNAYSALIKDLMAANIITGPEDEEELKELLANASTDTIKSLMESTVNSSLEDKQSSWKSNFTGAKKKFLEIEDAFNDTDRAIQMAQQLDYLETVSEDQIKDNVELQKQLYYQQLMAKNFSNADALEAIQEADELGKLADKATKALPALKQHAIGIVEESRKTTAAQQEQQRIANEESYTKLMSAIDSKEEFITGLKLNKVSRDKIKNNISAPVYTDESGKEYTSLMYKQKQKPAEFQMLINYYDSIGLFNLDKEGNFAPNVTKIKNAVKSKAVSELDSVLRNEEAKGLGKGNSGEVSQKTTGTLDFLENAFGKK